MWIVEQEKKALSAFSQALRVHLLVTLKSTCTFVSDWKRKWVYGRPGPGSETGPGPEGSEVVNLLHSDWHSRLGYVRFTASGSRARSPWLGRPLQPPGRRAHGHWGTPWSSWLGTAPVSVSAWQRQRPRWFNGSIRSIRLGLRGQRFIRARKPYCQSRCVIMTGRPLETNIECIEGVRKMSVRCP